MGHMKGRVEEGLEKGVARAGLTETRVYGRERGDRGLLCPPPPPRQERAGLRRGSRSLPRRLVVGAARERHACAPGLVTRSGMDSGSVAGERPKRTPGRQRLLPSGCRVPARPGISPVLGGRSWLRPRGRAARASPLLLLLLLPSPRLAATAPRRTLAECTRPGHAVPVAALGAGRNAQCRLSLGAGRVAALASSRRGEAGGRTGHPGGGDLPTPGRRFGEQSPCGRAPTDTHAQVFSGSPVGARETWEKFWTRVPRRAGHRGANPGMKGWHLRFDLIPNCIDYFMASPILWLALS